MLDLAKTSTFLWLFCILLGTTPCGSGKNDRGTYSYQYVHRLYNKKHYFDFTSSFEDNPEPGNVKLVADSKKSNLVAENLELYQCSDLLKF